MSVTRILAFRNDRLGEFLLTAPAFVSLKMQYPDAQLCVACAAATQSLIETIPAIDRSFVWEARPHGLRALLELIQRLRRERYDLCVIFNPTKEAHLASFFAGIPRRVGYRRKAGILLTESLPDLKYRGDRHEIDANLQLARLAGCAPQNLSDDLSITVNEAQAEPFLKAQAAAHESWIALHPWTSDPAKEWPLQHFRQLCDQLAAGHNRKILVIGGPEEAKRKDGFFDGLGAPVLDLVGKTTLPQLAGILKRCRLLISGDSGPVHLACAVGTPVLALFSTALAAKGPLRWGPRGPQTAVIGMQRIEDIRVSSVLRKANEMLADLNRPAQR